MNIQNRKVLITGGGSGIGLALGKEFLKRGSLVILCGRSREKLEAVRQAEPAFHVYPADITDPGSIAALRQEVEKDIGGIDVLLNNAGIFESTDVLKGGFAGNVEKHMSTNFFGPLNVIQEFLPVLFKNKPAAIINISSGAAYAPMPLYAGYSASKAALHSFTRALRTQLRSAGIEVAEILPPTVATGLTRRGMSPEKFATIVMRKLSAEREEINAGESFWLDILSRLSPRRADALLAKRYKKS